MIIFGASTAQGRQGQCGREERGRAVGLKYNALNELNHHNVLFR